MKKIQNIIMASAAATLLLTGCADDFDTSYPAGDKPESIAMDDLTRGYDVLKNYTGLKLGANLTVADLEAGNTNYSTVLVNFNEVNVSDGFSHAAMVADDGTVSADGPKEAIKAAIAAGLVPSASLFAPNAWNLTVMKEASKDTWVDGENIDLHQKYDFENDAINATYGSDKYSKVTNDPAKKNGKVLLNKMGGKSIEFPVSLPDGADLSKIKAITFDYYTNNIKKPMSVRLKAGDKSMELKNFGVPAKSKTWEIYTIDMSKIDLTEIFTADDLKSAQFSLVIGQAAVPQNVAIDNLDVYAPYQKSGYYVPRPNEEKVSDIQKAIYAYTDSVIDIYGDKVQTWTVASNLIDNLFYTLKNSENTADESEFYPNDYMDENWVADVAKRIHAKKADATLFYSEDQLLGDEEKAQAMVDYVNQWNEAGAKIEGLDVKIDVPYATETLKDTKAAYDKLLAKLVASDIQVRLSDMNVYWADGNGSMLAQSKATLADYQGMAELYAYLVSKAQEVLGDKLYGFSFSSLNQGNANIGLWKNYNRLPTYVGVANGLQKKNIIEW